MTEREMVAYAETLSPSEATRAWRSWYDGHREETENRVLANQREERRLRRRVGWNRRTETFEGLPERVCAWEYCSETFTPQRSTRRYCSAACRQRARRAA